MAVTVADRYHRRVSLRDAACLLLAVALGGCSLVVGKSIDPYDAEPVNFAGAYALQVTNAENGCAFANWEVGASTPNVPLTVTQDGDALTGELGGFWGTLADLILGNRRATGTATGSHMSLRLVGTRTQSVAGGCRAYQVDALFEGDLDGDYLEGTSTYTAVTNDDSAPCVALDGCETVQNFNGTRPPQ